jgi:hypothetical protein
LYSSIKAIIFGSLMLATVIAPGSNILDHLDRQISRINLR